MNISQELRNQVLVLVIDEQRLDAAKAPMLRDAIATQINEGHKLIAIDIGAANFMDSSGLSALVSSLKLLGASGRIAIVGAHGAVQRLFALTRMDKVFSLHASIDEAVAKLEA
jgi:anti-sigma B factor antagonist